MSENIYIEIESDLCIICLEKINNEYTNVCIKCNVKAHSKCLSEWYKKKHKRICPICLKSEDYYLKSILKLSNLNENNSDYINDENIDNILENEYDENNEYHDEYDSDSDDDEYHENDNTMLVHVNNTNLNGIKYICFCMFLIFIFISSYILTIYHIHLF